MNRPLAVAFAVVFAAGFASAENATLPAKKLQREYSKTVKKHVNEESAKTAGAYEVLDDVLQKKWPLKLVRIHKDRIVELGGDRFFACADFKEKGGKKTDLDLDFYVEKKGDVWVVEQVLVHKVEGKPRYTYNDKNERVPVK